MDPTGHDAFLRTLAYGHPAVMVVALGLAGLALRAGLAMRRRRLAKAPPQRGLLRSHLRVAKPGVLLLLAGFALGPISAFWLRDWAPLGTFHAWLGFVAAGLFGTAGLLGRKLERGRVEGDKSEAARVHGLVGAVAMLVAALAAAAGFVLLP